ncbi:D-alanine--D-alanine ligase [Acetobacterium woodii]|uniref:D-alanine--D-alanine ligase n=1 Tax=Acetobacterium woodii (strain ATCC 29683 / DSM 1030 / JCM 2381 / KCTC 1655 / WB1) TaxID=931626 RepID=H6LH26_ACEWD|nr:D-alanine--D-alanine ligase [Acetobacterium woodii]AFA47164.1 D-alanine--D-alanine ligase [Acetobacterium woodii DSM 1030]
MKNKLNIGVVFGGQSGEHEVSRVSAYNVLGVIDRDKYNIITIGISKKGKWFLFSGDSEKIKDGSWEQDQKNLIADFSIFSHQEISKIDIFFPVLHGPMGEDGTIQGVFEMLNKPYVGCGVLSSAVGMDKVFSKIMFESVGIPTGKYIYFRENDWKNDQATQLAGIEAALGYPVFVKPANMGSSVGISKAHDRDELILAINEAFIYDNKLILEAFIKGREIECAVLQVGDTVRASIPGEVIPSKEFYDYEAKYSATEDSKVVIPADLSQEVTEKIRNYAIKAFEAIEGSGLSRVDFFVTEDEVLINEVNTLPGFTNISMYPKMWEATGIGYKELVDTIIASAQRKRVTVS